MLLQVSAIKKSYNGEEILKDCSFHIEENEKCALVGANGTGKSTLLKIIAHVTEPDSGNVTMKSDEEIGYLAQQEAVNSENTIYDELMEAKRPLLDEEEQIRSLEKKMKDLTGEELELAMERYSALTHHFEINNGFAIQSEVTGVLKGLGFAEEEFDKVISTLSGGQKTRVALAKLLLTHPSLIMLDEPTNHLDMLSIEWLEGFLSSYKGAVLVVAHDRYFLDRIATKVIDIENGKSHTYSGNYTAFSEKKKALREAALRAYMNQQAEITHQEKVIEKLKSYNREKSIKRAESREKLLDHMERLDKPEDINDAMKLKITPSIRSGRDVLAVTSLTKAYSDSALFSDVSFSVTRGERVAVIGNNGTGKTTLLKILTGLTEADSGSFMLGTNVKIGYYDQEHQVLHPEKTLFQEMSDDFPDMDNTRIRNTLAAFLFYGDDVFKQVKALSGGERGRLSLAKLMLSKANFLILDEPTNHLDTTSKEILENALNEYEGTLLYVSHDRYFINQTATRILVLSNGAFTSYPGNYDYYLEKKDNADASKDEPSASIQTESDNKLFWQEQKARDAAKRKTENRIKKIEAEIADLESRNTEIEALMSDPDIATDTEKLTGLSAEAGELNSRLEALYDEWAKLSEFA
ncbi:MAG: ABC-F family ATP-binding cassette domain-containing protein [Lachnospiraceae bacterium]|nr:ABC-F family ATP-binding cassette domain-containing protein [Lachnospiraceae bacterium]